MTIEVTVLDNGLTIATDPMVTVETASLGVWFGAGTRHEPIEANGIAHLLEHMAFKGTRRRSARAIAEEIEAVGGHLNAHTGREQTAYYAKVMKEDVALAFDIIADILLESVFDPEELAREREVVLQEIGQVADTPDDIIFDHFQATAFPGQRLGRPVLGSAEVVASLSRDSLVSFKQGLYGASSMVLAAAGRIEHRTLVELGTQAFGHLPALAKPTADPAHYVGGEFRESDSLEQAHLLVGFPGLAWTDPDYYALAMMSTLLGGGMSSRLFQEAREQRGLCYAIYSFVNAFHDGGMFGVYAGTGEELIDELIPVIAEQLRSVTEPAAAEEVRRARAQLKASLLMSLESTSARMENLASQLLIFGRPLPTEELIQRVEGVTAEQMAAVAERLLQGPPTLAAMGPTGRLESVDRFAKRLA